MHPKRRTIPLVNFSKRSDVELHPDEGGVVEEKPHQRIQTGVLPAGAHRQQASRSDLSRAQPLRERAFEVAQGEYEERGEAAFTEKQLSHSEALEARIAELERFCGKLALENEILKKGLSRYRSGGGIE